MTLVYLGSAWLLGIYLHFLSHPSPYCSCPSGLVIPLVILAPLGLLSLVIFFLRREDRRGRLLATCVIISLLGAWRYSLSLHKPDENDVDFPKYRGWVTVEGVVWDYPDERGTYTNIRLKATRVEIEGQGHDVRGLVLIRAPRYPEYAYGDRLRVAGLLQTPPEFETFSYEDYLARQGIYAMMYRPKIKRLARNQGIPFWAALYAFKAKAQATIAQILPEPEASLLTGILLGVERGIPADLLADFSHTGTTHIIVISGFNITVLAGALSRSANRLFSKRTSLLVALIGVTLYTILVGADLPVLRAASMGSLSLTALLFGRQSYALISLAVAAFLMTIVNPHTLLNVSFQLSAAATLSLILFVPSLAVRFERWLSKLLPKEWARPVLGFLKENLVVTLAAQILVLPLIIYYFGHLSLSLPFTNLLILPAQPGIMFLGGAATILGLFYSPLGRGLGWAVWLLLAYTIGIVRASARISFASVKLEGFSPLLVWLYYGVLAAGCWFIAQEPEGRREVWRGLARHLSTKAVIFAMLIIAALVWTTALSLPDNYLHVVFFDIGQGDSIFIITPTGQQILIDGGPNPTTLLSALGKEMPFWDRSLDLVIMTHPDEDHIGGLVPALERYRVEQVLEPDLPCNSALCDRWQALLEERAIPVQIARRGMRVDLDRGLWMEVLHPSSELLTGTGADDNNNSIVLRLVYGKASFLLTGDLEEEGERDLLTSGQQLTSLVLKVSHHGAKAGTTDVFLKAVQPQLAIISVGQPNRFDHPAKETLDRLGGIETLRTDQQGSVKVAMDGERYWIDTER